MTRRTCPLRGLWYGGYDVIPTTTRTLLRKTSLPSKANWLSELFIVFIPLIIYYRTSSTQTQYLIYVFSLVNFGALWQDFRGSASIVVGVLINVSYSKTGFGSRSSVVVLNIIAITWAIWHTRHVTSFGVIPPVRIMTILCHSARPGKLSHGHSCQKSLKLFNFRSNGRQSTLPCEAKFTARYRPDYPVLKGSHKLISVLALLFSTISKYYEPSKHDGFSAQHTVASFAHVKA